MTEPSHSLLCRSPLQPGESLLSLLARLSELNLYPDPTILMRICRERLVERDNVTQPAMAETYKVLVKLVGIDADELYAASVHRFAATITPPPYQKQSILLPSGREVYVADRPFLQRNIRWERDLQFCPLCLKESVYHRLSWMPMAVALCLNHQCLLVHRCPYCQKNITIQDVLRAKCLTCGFHLTESPVISVASDKFGLFSQTVIQSWLLGISPPPNVEIPYSLPSQPVSVLYRILVGLCRAITNIQDNWHYLHEAPIGIDSSIIFPLPQKRDITPTQS
ncbi:MAG: TniQ family protein [Anaerolineae bacterium]|nr:TniQ family protein [Anaerolineae bacterium]